MQDSRLVCVADATVLIDLQVGGLLREFLRLPFRIATPDTIVAEELLAPNGTGLVEHGLHVESLSATQLQQAAVLNAGHRSVSLNDCCALILARVLGAMLLTGDGPLMRLARTESVPAHGVLWILDELVRLRTVSPCRAGLALRRMLGGGSRLPVEECRRRLKCWLQEL